MAEALVSEPFRDAERQREADRLGMLVFLASEIMLFGGLFAVALTLRLRHPAEYQEAAAGLHIWLGTINTAILLTSSLLVALAVEAARADRSVAARRLLLGAAALGVAFLGVKGLEYYAEFREGVVPVLAPGGLSSPFETLLMTFYFISTGLHAVHVTIGIAMLAMVALARSPARMDPPIVLGNVALYWHLVDIVWIFLYPTLYLVGRG